MFFENNVKSTLFNAGCKQKSDRLVFFSMKERDISAEEIAKKRAWFARRGISLKSWAEQHQVNPNVLYQVLQGKTLCTRGESHRVAVLLGLKVEGTDELAPALAAGAISAHLSSGDQDGAICPSSLGDDGRQAEAGSVHAVCEAMPSAGH
jgi:gp16 family phage-associated protein